MRIDISIGANCGISESTAPALAIARTVEGMEFHPIAFDLGPENGRFLIRTHREGLGARAGHDLLIEATRWAGHVRIDAGEPPRGRVELLIDARGLEVRQGRGGARPLTDEDRLEIKSNIEGKVLHADRDPELKFAAEKVAVDDHHVHLTGDLTIGGQTHPASVEVDLEPAIHGVRAHGAVRIRQTDYGIKPYSALMGMLKVADQVVVDFELRLPSETISGKGFPASRAVADDEAGPGGDAASALAGPVIGPASEWWRLAGSR